MSRSRRKRGYRDGGGRPPQYMGSVVSEGDSRVVRTGEVIDLGDLTGESRQPVTASFVFHDWRIRVNPDLTELDVVDLLDAADKVNTNDPKSIIMVKEYVKAHIHPEDFERFWELARKHRHDTANLMSMCWGILDGITGNPTGGRSDSSGGQPATKTSSPPTPSGQVTDLGEAREQRQRREAYERQLQALEAARGEDGKPIPVNAAIALQIVEHAKTQGIDLSAGRPLAAATG